jgi:hypothetical protein
MKKNTILILIMLLSLNYGCSNYVSDNTPVKKTTQQNPNPIPNPDDPIIDPPNVGPEPIDLTSNRGVPDENDLGACGNYVILGKAGISNVTGSLITGDLGVSPMAATGITGFSLIMDASNAFSTSVSVVGKVYAADYASPTPANLTSSISCIERAYTDAVNRVDPDFNKLLSGNIGGLTLVPGLYKWTTNIVIPNDVTLFGGVNDVWIFQTTGDLLESASKQIILSGGAQAKNIFWQVAGQVTLGANSHFEGIILSQTGVALQTGATFNGRIMAQSAVALDDNDITAPE